jgi:hypothetical protein
MEQTVIINAVYVRKSDPNQTAVPVVIKDDFVSFALNDNGALSTQQLKVVTFLAMFELAEREAVS